MFNSCINRKKSIAKSTCDKLAGFFKLIRQALYNDKTTTTYLLPLCIILFKIHLKYMDFICNIKYLYILGFFNFRHFIIYVETTVFSFENRDLQLCPFLFEKECITFFMTYLLRFFFFLPYFVLKVI